MYVNRLLLPDYHTKINMYNSLEPFYNLVPFGKSIMQYAVYINLCEYNHIFTLNVSHSGELLIGKKL